MRNTTRTQALPDTRPCEVRATINLAKGKRLAIGKEIESLLDALAVEGSVEHIDALFFRVYRGTGKGRIVAWNLLKQEMSPP